MLAEAVKCAQALKTDELITDTRVKEAFAQLINEVYPRLPESLQDQLIADFRLNILHRAQEKNTPPVELMDGEQEKNFLRKKGARTNTLWIIEKLVLLVGVCCFVYLMSLYVTGYWTQKGMPKVYVQSNWAIFLSNIMLFVLNNFYAG